MGAATLNPLNALHPQPSTLNPQPSTPNPNQLHGEWTVRAMGLSPSQNEGYVWHIYYTDIDMYIRICFYIYDL